MRHMAHRFDDHLRDEGAVGIGADHIFINDLFRSNDDILRGKSNFLLLAHDAPDVRIAVLVGALHMDDPHIWDERRHRDHLTASVRIGNTADAGIAPLKISGRRLVHGHEWKASRAGLQA